MLLSISKVILTTKKVIIATLKVISATTKFFSSLRIPPLPLDWTYTGSSHAWSTNTALDNAGTGLIIMCPTIFMYSMCGCFCTTSTNIIHYYNTINKTSRSGQFLAINDALSIGGWLKWHVYVENGWVGDVVMWQKWNSSGFRPPLCTYRLNWARRTFRG